MALLFSAVRATANDQEVEFFVGGIPREYDDLEGWTAFDRFMEDIDEETEVAIHTRGVYGKVIICTVVKNFVAGIGINNTLCIYPAFFKPLCHLKNTLSVIADGVIFARNQQYG